MSYERYHMYQMKGTSCMTYHVLCFHISFPVQHMKKSDSLRFRKRVQSFAKKGCSVSFIARELGVSRKFVRRWKDVDDATKDDRGWQKGKKRKYTDAQEQKILAARDEAEEGFFSEHMLLHKSWRSMPL